jgi:PIN domain nuclease of toxin-antitoxin system
MKFLLDTHLLLWVALGHKRLSRATVALLTDANNEILFSVSSIWEIAIKRGLKKTNFLHDPREIRRQMIANGYDELTIQSQHVVAVDSLAPIHKDPFDRLLIAQAMVEGVTLLTADAIIAGYPGPIRKV